MRIRPVAVVSFVAVVGWASAWADDFFLTIGGGYDATGNQVSLERNVVFQQSVLARQRPDKPVHEIYFADGEDEARDLQLCDANFEKSCSRARRLMAELLGDESTMNLVYRNHNIVGETGPSEPKLIERRMKKLASELAAGDRLFIYATAHGGSAEIDEDYGWHDDELTESTANEYDTSLYMWDGDSITASEFSRWLDQLSPDVEVILVMVQCYSGGFSHTMFHDADSDLGMSNHRRCGFFSQVHDRPAAGCTPDIDNDDYQEYSGFFWAALGGETRAGKPITSADYNGDGSVSFAEAHAYAVIESDTIDIPISTSGEFLRKYSSLGKKKPGDDDADKPTGIGGLFGMLAGSEKDGPQQELLELRGSLAELAHRGSPHQRAILERLPEMIGIEGKPSITAINNRLKKIEAEQAKASVKYGTTQSTYSRISNGLVEAIEREWPELTSPYAPLAMELCNERADEFVAKVESLPNYAAFRRAQERNERAMETYREYEHLEAKAQRLLRTCENIVLEANLDKIATSEIVERYRQLRAMEDGLLVPSP